MKMKTTLSLAAAFACAVLSTASTHAQDVTPAEAERARLHKDLKTLSEQFMMRYWEPRLNAYKVRIDGILSRPDLAQLDELRARFAIVFEQMREREKEDRAAYGGSYSTDGTATSDTVIVAAPVAVTESATAPRVADSSDGTEISYNPTAIGEASEEDEATWRKQNEERQEREADEAEAALTNGGTPARSRGLESFQEFMQLPAVASWLARNYRSQLDLLSDDILIELGHFADSLQRISRAYIDAHGAEYKLITPTLADADMLGSTAEFERMVRHPRMFREMFRQHLQSFVMLYNGEGLARMLSSITGEHEAPADLPAPAMTVKTSPNPATTSANLVYVLPETSTATIVRLVDGRGETVLERKMDGGAAGSYETVLDVAGLSSGWYVCQVTAQLPQGPYVASCVVRVMR